MKNETTVRKFYPSNPLGIIAIFVFFIEAISASSMYSLKDHVDLLKPLVYFIIGFPSAIAILFFIFLWTKPQSFFSPADYRTDDSFLNAIKKELSFNQQIIKAYTGPPTVIDESYRLADKLVEKKEYLEAIRIGRGYLKFEEYYKCYKFFIYLADKIPQYDEFYPVCIGNIAYSLVGLSKFNEAIVVFKQIENSYPDRFQIWHLAPLTYCYFMTSREAEFEIYVARLNKHPKLPEEIFEYAKRYPQMADKLRTHFEID